MRGRILGVIRLLLGVPDRFAIGGEVNWQDLAARPTLLDYEGSPKEQVAARSAQSLAWTGGFVR